MAESNPAPSEWETPVLVALGDLDSLTSAGVVGSEDGSGFMSF